MPEEIRWSREHEYPCHLTFRVHDFSTRWKQESRKKNCHKYIGDNSKYLLFDLTANNNATFKLSLKNFLTIKRRILTDFYRSNRPTWPVIWVVTRPATSANRPDRFPSLLQYIKTCCGCLLFLRLPLLHWNQKMVEKNWNGRT